MSPAFTTPQGRVHPTEDARKQAAAGTATQAARTPMIAPVIETERLRLRRLKLADAPWIARESARPEVNRMVTRIPPVNPPLFAEMFVLTVRAAEPVRGDAVRRIEDLASARPLGVIGAHPRGDGMYEFGYWLAVQEWGRGVASEAGRALIAALAEAGITRLAAGFMLDNPASARVLAKLGFVETGDTETAYSLGRMKCVDVRRMVRI